MQRSVLFVALCGTAIAGPASLICEDERMVDGGKMMHLYVTSNEFDTGVSFTADRTQYKYGDSITISIKGTGQRFAGFKFGVQVEFTGNNGEAMGYFHNLSQGLMATPGCSTSVYLDAGMGTAQHTLQWTPHYEATGLRLKTTGNATFKIVYGNGPGNAGYEQVAAPALYLQTVTLWDPKKWNPTTPGPPSPGPPPPPQACFNSTKNSFKGSPVFIQRVGKTAGKTQGASQTFQANRCLRCRHDQHCRSAKVVCPIAPGMIPVEHIWHNNPACNGTADRVAGLKESEAWCPGPDHYSPENLNLTRFVPKLLRDQSPYFQDTTTAERAIEEYKRMLTLVQRFPDAPVVPSKLVDIVWHEHVLDTQTYQRDCLRMFGHYLHHAPSFGGGDEKAEMVQQQQDMLLLYTNEFGENPGRDMWPMTPSDPSSDEKMPDCCSALCVKPSCAGCVGCNSVYCGYRATDLPAEEQTKRTLLAPEQFAGYVPTVEPQRIPKLAFDESSAFAGYQCEVSPTQQMRLGWSISNGYIYFKQQLTGNAWYGVGLNNASTMAGADYMITMAAGKGNTAFGQNNFSGVKDMYLFGEAAGYPCWDIEYECSAGNKTKGTHDLEDQVINRQVGVTYSTWNRKLDTGDFKDYVITDAEAFALFAWGDLNGNGDEFRYHKDNAVVCSVDFYTGESTC